MWLYKKGYKTVRGLLFIIVALVISLQIPLLEQDNFEQRVSAIVSYKVIYQEAVCNNVKEKIFEDQVYVYYLPCEISDHIYIQFEDGSKVSIFDALYEYKMDIEELAIQGLNYLKEEK